MNVFVGLEFDDGEASVAGGGENVDHGAIAGSEGWDLRIDMQTIETRVEDGDVADDQRFDPTLRHGTVNGVGAIAGVAASCDVAEVIVESGLIRLIDGELSGTHAKVKLLGWMEGVARGGQTRTGKLKAVQAEDEFARRNDDRLGVGDNREHLCDGSGEALQGGMLIRRMDETGGDVAGVGGVKRGELLGAFVEFVELPLGQVTIEVSDTLAQHGRSAGWNKQLEAFHDDGGSAMAAAGIEPQNTESQGGIDGCLHFRGIHAKYCEGRIAATDQRPRIDGAEGMLQVHAGGDRVKMETRVFDGEYPLK